MIPRFAIIDDNILTGLGLQDVLHDIIPVAEISVFQTVEQLMAAEDPKGTFVHYFVSSRIYFEHTQFFREQHARSIVLVAGAMQITGVKTLNVCQSEKALVRDIIELSSMGHATSHMPEAPEAARMMARRNTETVLSAREVEVALLLAKGYINKEVAEELNISLTTVITHRKNIMEKLHARSLADVIVYVVMNGMVDVSEL